MLRNISKQEILEQYKNGVRDFRKIRCICQDFYDLCLKEIDFSGSDLEFCGFAGSNLSKTNFSNCNLVWSGFDRANLTETNFKNAKLNWSSLNRATFKNTIMINADLSWSIIFETNRGELNLSGAIIDTVAWNLNEITESGISFARENLARLKDFIPYDLWLQLKFEVENTSDKSKKQQKINNRVSDYQQKTKTPYDTEIKKILQIMGLGAYGNSKNREYGTKPVYKPRDTYGKK
ncbi:MAG: pentapeptide repeat-containing protein [Candidatus Aenigmatarchaeota archaeon]